MLKIAIKRTMSRGLLFGIPMVSLICAYVIDKTASVYVLQGYNLSASDCFLFFYGLKPLGIDIDFNITHLFFIALPFMSIVYLCAMYQQVNVFGIKYYPLIRYTKKSRWLNDHVRNQAIIVLASTIMFNLLLYVFFGLIRGFGSTNTVFWGYYPSITPMFFVHHLAVLFIVTFLQLLTSVIRGVYAGIILSLIIVAIWAMLPLIGYRFTIGFASPGGLIFFDCVALLIMSIVVHLNKQKGDIL